MARASKIQWTKSYQKELARQVKNYNARLSRAKQKYPGYIQLPTLKVKDLKRDIKTKQQYNVLLRDIKRATSKVLVPSETGRTVYEESLSRLAVRRKTQSPISESIGQPKKLVEAEKKIDALSKLRVDKEPGRFPTERNMILRNIGVIEGGPENYDKIIAWIESNISSNIRWKENYIKAIDGVIEGLLISGDEEGIEAYEQLRELISGMDIEDFVIGQLIKSERVGISYVYTMKGESAEGIALDLLNQWSNIYV